MLPERTNSKGFAIDRDGTKVLYRCARCKDETWFDFSKVNKYLRWPIKRRTELAENSAIFVMSWHSEKKGGGYINCKVCEKNGL